VIFDHVWFYFSTIWESNITLLCMCTAASLVRSIIKSVVEEIWLNFLECVIADLIFVVMWSQYGYRNSLKESLPLRDREIWWILMTTQEVDDKLLWEFFLIGEISDCQHIIWFWCWSRSQTVSRNFNWNLYHWGIGPVVRFLWDWLPWWRFAVSNCFWLLYGNGVILGHNMKVIFFICAELPLLVGFHSRCCWPATSCTHLSNCPLHQTQIC